MKEEEMNSGLLIYNSSEGIFNVGDYIQSLAAKQYFHDKTDFYVNRERLNNYSGRELKIIMNGWFMHEPKNWPPSRDIVPLFVSFHINSVAKNLMLTTDSIEYLKKWQPIGCRDKETVRLLRARGVDAYFSGCLTLTLGQQYKSTEKTNEIYFVDPYFEYKKNIPSLLKYFSVLVLNYRKIKKITSSFLNGRNRKKNGIFVSLIKFAAFYHDYSRVFEPSLLENAIYINKEINESQFASEQEKFNYASDLIRKYASAKFIVTSRIHCALPSLGLETPVLYVENVNQAETSYCRLDGLREFFHIISYDKGKMQFPVKLTNGKIGPDLIFKNKFLHIPFKEELIKKCKDFVSVKV